MIFQFNSIHFNRINFFFCSLIFLHWPFLRKAKNMFNRWRERKKRTNQRIYVCACFFLFVQTLYILIYLNLLPLLTPTFNQRKIEFDYPLLMILIKYDWLKYIPKVHRSEKCFEDWKSAHSISRWCRINLTFFLHATSTNWIKFKHQNNIFENNRGPKKNCYNLKML